MPTRLIKMTREMALRYITIAETAAEPELLDILLKIITFKEMPTVLREPVSYTHLTLPTKA